MSDHDGLNAIDFLIRKLSPVSHPILGGMKNNAMKRNWQGKSALFPSH